MFSNALKSISATNITANYQVSSTLTSTAGPWKIYSAKRKSTGKEYSVFVFDKKAAFDAHSSGLSRSSASAFKEVLAEVIERLKKEALSLAKLRHPSVLELVEPVEETRSGGLQFVTEPVTASLASLLQEKDDQERSGGVGGRASRYVTEDSDGTRRRRELEIDELEIQKGLLQLSKALEFLHENAGLVHGNLTPDAVLINAKGDWKISGLAFCSPPPDSDKPTSFKPIALSEVLQPDPRLPRSLQLNLDYTSPDFVLDKNMTVAADMFSLGLLCIALYNSPHRSPLECHASLSTCKRNFTAAGGTPSQTNNYLSARPIPKDLASQVLPRLLTRRPANRMTAKEFQQSEYFDNILVSTIRFLDSFPAKTANEKQQFLRGLIKVLPSFPKSVMEKKVLPALLEELKDKELLSLILHNLFKIIELLPAGKKAFNKQVRPTLKEIFVTNAKPGGEKDPTRDAGLMIVLERLPLIADNCSGAEFKDDILPIIFVALESPTPTLVNAALTSLPTILSVLDFTTIKNELFPVIATIFSKTNSLAIKVRGLQAFVALCGGSNDPGADDGLDGFGDKKKGSSSALDKYTMQEKIVPLIKAIKTKEPAVMMAALNTLKVIGNVADADFVAMDILPILWAMSLGPLLDLKQFQAFMDLIKTLSRRVEDEQTKKLQELSGGNVSTAVNDDFMSFGTIAGSSLEANGTSETDFEMLVKGKSGGAASSPLDSGWDNLGSPNLTITSPGIKPSGKTTPTPAFSWSTPSPTTATSGNQFGALKAQQPTFRTVTPDLGRFEALTPSSTQYSQPLQPINTTPQQQQPPPSINWGSASAATSNPWSNPSPQQQQPPTSAFGSMSLGQMQSPASNQGSRAPSFALPPPPAANTPTLGSGSSGFSLAPPPGAPQRQTSFGGLGNMGSSNLSSLSSMGGPSMSSLSSMGGSNMPSLSSMSNSGINSGMNSMNSMNSLMNKNTGGMGMSMGMGMGMAQQQQQQQQQQAQQGGQKSGLDKYASLL